MNKESLNPRNYLETTQKETLPAVEVDNRVLWINPAFEKTSPFKMEVGKSTRLGLFLTPASKDNTEGTRQIKIPPEERTGRSGILGSVMFQDQEGHMYRDVSLKGIGFYEWGGWVSRPETYRW